MSPIRVFIAEDNEDLRTAVELLLTDVDGVVCVGGTPCVDEIASLVAQSGAQVVVLDVELQGKSSLMHLPQLCLALPAVQFVMYSGHANPRLIDGALAAGAREYVIKSGEVDDLVAAIRRCVASVPASV